MRILRWLIALAANYASGLDIFGSEIDSVDPAPVPAGNEPRGPAKATSDIKNMHIGRDTELIDEMFGCLAAAGMKLVYGPEIIDGHRIDRLANDVDTFLSESNRKQIDHRLLIATTDRIGAPRCQTGQVDNQQCALRGSRRRRTAGRWDRCVRGQASRSTQIGKRRQTIRFPG